MADFKEMGKLQNLDPAPRPAAFNVGDTFKAILNGKDHQATVIKVTADETTWKDDQGCVIQKLTFGFTLPSKWENCVYGTGNGIVKLKNDPWPLTLGKKWKSHANGQGWQTTRSCKVAAAVKVSTTLGEFDTYKVKCNDSWNKVVWYIDVKTGNSVYITNVKSFHKINDKFETTQFR